MREKNRLRTSLLAAIMGLLCLSACNVRRPEMVISNNKMADVLYDYHMTKAMIKNRTVPSDDEKQAYMDFVFKKHGITEEVFDSSLSWYSHNPDQMTSVYDQVFARMNRESEGIKQRISARDNLSVVSKPGDTVDVWTERRMIRVSNKAFENLLTFKIDADQYYEATDTMRWSMNYHFMNGEPTSERAPIMMMQIWYDRDSVISEQRIVRQDGRQTITLQNDSLGDLKSVQGFIYYPKQEDSTKFLLLDDISLMRLHSEKKRTEVADTLGSEKKEAPLTRPVRVSTGSRSNTRP